jgi:glycerophosphoryl diester phosphodiesterase
MTRQTRPTPEVVAHRGASGYRPEHTLAAYRLAVALGADAVEVDVVAGKDGVLVARHEPELGCSTDVAMRPEYAARRTTKVVDGRRVEGWFVDDFTTAELRTLWAVERLPLLRPGSARFDGRFPVPTLAEVLALVGEERRRVGREIRVYVELKHPMWFAARGLDLAGLLLGELGGAGGVTVMAFETEVLRSLRSRTAGPLVQLVAAGGAPYDRAVVGDLVTYREMATPRGLMRIAEYADAVGLARNVVLPRTRDDRLGRPGWVVSDAHALDLDVLVWTLRDENCFLPADLRRGRDPAGRGGAVGEHHAFLLAGVDAVIGDHPDTAAEARRLLQLARASGGFSAAQSSMGMSTHATM